MKMKKVLAVMLIGSMTAGLAACGTTTTTTGSSTDSTEAAADGASEGASDTAAAGETKLEADDLADIIPDETVTLDVYDQLANYSGEQIGWFGKVLLDKFNVKLNIIPEADGVFDTRMEDGNLGDLVIWGDDSDNYQEAIKKGMLFDWEEDDILNDYGPYIAANMTEALDKNRNLSKTVTGEPTLYGFGHAVATSATEPQSAMYTWDLRFDLYQQIGSPEIKDYDDMVDALAKMQEACPTDDNGNKTYGVSLFNDWDGDMAMFVKSTASAYYGYDEFGFGLYDPETQTYHDCLEENGPYLTTLKFYNNLYQKGLLDPDSQTQGYDGMSADYQNGTAFLNVFNFMGSALYNSDAHLSEGKAMYSVIPTDARPIVYGQSVYGGNRVWSIGANTEYPELCMAIINWLSTPEGRMTTEYGPKDTCWYYDENGNTCFTDLGLACKTDITTDMSEAGYTGTFDDGSFKMNNTTWALDAENPDSNGETYNYLNWKSYNETVTSDIKTAWQKWSGYDTADEYTYAQDYILAPGTTYSAGAHSDELQVTWDQVATCIKNYSWQAIYAKSDKEFDSIVAEMTKQAKAYGYDDCVDFQKNEATIRAKAEDEAMATAGVTTDAAEATTEAATEATTGASK